MGKENAAPSAGAIDFTSQLLTQDDVFKTEVNKPDPNVEEVKVDKPTGLTQEDIFEKPTKVDKKPDEATVADEKNKSGSPDSDGKTAANADNETPDSLVFAKSLKEQGLLDDLNEEQYIKIFNESGKDFYEPLKVAIQENFSRKEAKIKEELGQQARGFMEWKNLADQGINPQEAFTITYQKEKINAITEDALKENQDLRKEVLYNLYKETTQWSDGEIENFINDQVALKKDTDLANNAVPKLKTIYDNREKQMVEQQKARAQQEEMELQESLKDLQKKIPDEFLGNKFHSKTKDEIYDMIAKPVVKYPDGSTANEIWADYNKDPNTFMMKVAVLKKIGIWDGKIDRIKQTVKNETVSDLQKVIERQAGKERNAGGLTVIDKERPSDKSLRDRAERKLIELREQNISRQYGNI
jgi:hypothetical protein